MPEVAGRRPRRLDDVVGPAAWVYQERVVRLGMADPQDARVEQRYPDIPELEIDETIPPRPEEEAADIQRGTPAPGDRTREAKPRP